MDIHNCVNHTAALKCRQRKKAWLAQLQAKVEYLSNENERLTQALVSSREEITRLSALVGASGVVPNSNNVPVNSVPVNGISVNGMVNGNHASHQPPVSVSVSLPPGGKNASAMVGGGGGGRGYGY